MAFTIRSMKIRQQILLVTLPPLAVLLCALALLFYAYWMALHVNRASRRSLESIALGEQTLRRVTELYLGVRGYVFTRDRMLLAPHEELPNQILAGLANLRDLESDNPAQLADVDNIQRGLNRWQSEWVNPTISNLDRGIALDTARVAADGARRLAPIRKQLLDLLEADRAESLAALHDAEQQMRRMLVFALVVGLMVAGAVLLVTREVARLLEQPVRQLIEASERVSRGEFDLSLPPKDRKSVV